MARLSRYQRMVRDAKPSADFNQAKHKELEFRKKLLIEEIKRRRREGRAEIYEPNRKGEGERCQRCGQVKSSQYQFHRSNAKFRLLHAGDRSGKTEAATIEFIWHCIGAHPLKPVQPPYKFRVCGDGMTDQVEQVLVEKYHELVPKRFLDGGSWAAAYSRSGHTLDINDNRGNTSRIGFVSYDQDSGKLAGKDLDGVHHDEPSPRSFWQENRSRLIDRNGFAIFTFTPRYNMLALWEYELYERARNGHPDYAVFNLHTEDNPYLSEDGVRSIIEEIGDDEDQLRMRLCGEFRQLGGLVYPVLKKDFHVRTAAEVGWNPAEGRWPTGVAIDPGIRKEHAVLWFAVGPGPHIHCYREYASDGTIPDLVRDINRLSGLDLNMQYFLIDGHWDWDNRTAISKDGVAPLNIEREFHKCGLMVKKAPLDIKVWPGIGQVTEMLKPRYPSMIPYLTFEPELERTWFEMTHYGTIPPKKDDPTRHNPRIRKVDDDFCDCVRIIVTSNPTNAAGYIPPSLYKDTVLVDEYGLAW